MLHSFLSTYRTPEAYKATLELHMTAITTNDDVCRQYLLNIPTCIQLIALTSEESTDDELVMAGVRHLVCTLPQRPLDIDPANLLKCHDDLADQTVWLEKEWSVEN